MQTYLIKFLDFILDQQFISKQTYPDYVNTISNYCPLIPKTYINLIIKMKKTHYNKI